MVKEKKSKDEEKKKKIIYKNIYDIESNHKFLCINNNEEIKNDSFSENNPKQNFDNNDFPLKLEIHFKLEENSKRIRLFGQKFFARYNKGRDLFTLIINNEQKKFCEFLEAPKIVYNKIIIIYFIIQKEIQDLSYMFADCKNIIYVKGLENLINNKANNINNIFLNCSSIKIVNNTIIDWKTEFVTDMKSTFRGCISIKSLGGISKWNTKKVTNMSSMFYECNNLENIKFDKWNTNNSNCFSGLFYKCNKLKTIDTSKFNFGKNKDLSLMFYGCENLEKLSNLNNWDIQNVKSMKAMFYDCKKLEKIPGIGDWSTKNLVDMGSMFYGCKSLCSIPDIFSKWDLSKVTDISNLFYKCKNLDFSSINFANGDLSNVEDMNGMFYGCEKLIEIKEFSKINNIKNVSFMFYDCINLKKLPEKLNFNTNNLTEAKGMFYDCKSLEKIPDMSNWNFNKVKNLSFMFFGCEKIEEIPNKLNDKYYTKDKDISYFDYNCKNIKGKIKFFREIEKEGCFGKCGGIMNKINKKIIGTIFVQ